MAEILAISDSTGTGRARVPAHIVWPGIVIGLLLMSAGFMGATIYFAVSDPQFSVEPDYYEKALAWDDTAAQAGRNARLGWKLAIDASGGADPRGHRTVRFELTDASGVSLEGAAIALEFFHNAASSERLKAEVAGAEGGYVASLPLRKPGLWEFRVTVTRGPDTFTSVQQVLVGGGT